MLLIVIILFSYKSYSIEAFINYLVFVFKC